MNVQFWLVCHEPKMNIHATFRSEHSWNVQIWHYINIKLRYFIFHENWTVTECFHCPDNFQYSDNIQNPNDSFSIQLWTFYEYSHLNIHTIFILNYEGIIFERLLKHSWHVPWMLPCPLFQRRPRPDLTSQLLFIWGNSNLTMKLEIANEHGAYTPPPPNHTHTLKVHFIGNAKSLLKYAMHFL